MYYSVFRKDAVGTNKTKGVISSEVSKKKKKKKKKKKTILMHNKLIKL